MMNLPVCVIAYGLLAEKEGECKGSSERRYVNESSKAYDSMTEEAPTLSTLLLVFLIPVS